MGDGGKVGLNRAPDVKCMIMSSGYVAGVSKIMTASGKISKHCAAVDHKTRGGMPKALIGASVAARM
jgi:hypothetical protein